MLTQFSRVAKQTSKRLTALAAASVMAFSGLALAAPMFFSGSAAAATPGDILINEISPASATEWVELYNPSSTSVSVANWSVQFDATSTSQTSTLSGSIPGHGYMVVTTGGNTWLANSGDTVILKDDSATTINTVTYSTTIASNKSYARTTNGGSTWSSAATPTQGKSNDPTNELSVCAGGCDYATISAAVSAISANGTIYVGQGTYSLTSELDINQPMSLVGDSGVTIMSNNSSWSTTSSGKHLVGIYGGSSTNPVSISNITFDSNGQSYGVNTYNDAYGDLNNVTIENSKGAALTVNGSGIVATSLNTSGNSWGAVNVDPGSGVATPSVFTLNSGTLSEDNQIWSDGSHVNGSATVTVNASGYKMYKVGGSSNAYFWTNQPLENYATITKNAVTTVYSTIQAAVSAASTSSADTINVTPGNYNVGSLTISKSLNLLGPNKDANPYTDTRTSEATITGQILVTASNVSVEGLTLTDPTYSGASVKAIQVYGSGTQVSNVTIQNNIFTNVENSAAHGAYGVMVQGNVKTIEIFTNQFSGINATASGGWAHAIEVSPTSSNGSIPQDVRIIGNNFSNITNVGNSDAYAFSVDSATYNSRTIYADASQILPFAGNSLAGLKIRNLDPNHTLDLTDNWWGNVLGASSSQYSGNVNVTTWCTDSTCTSDQSASSGSTDLPSGSLGTPTTSGSTATLTLPATNDVVASTTTSTGTVQVTIPAGVTISAPATSNWDGTITAPAVTTVQLGSTKTVSLAIQVGASGVDLTFNKAVRLVLPGQAGKSVGFVNAEGEFSTIDACVAADDQAAQDTALLAGGDCYLASGGDLVVWTKHFTTFVTYTPVSTSSGGTSSNSSGSKVVTTSSSSSTGSNNGSGAGAVQGQSTNANSGKTSSISTNKPAVASLPEPKVAAKEAVSGGLRWYWMVLIAIAAVSLAALVAYRLAEGTDKSS